MWQRRRYQQSIPLRASKAKSHTIAGPSLVGGGRQTEGRTSLAGGFVDEGPDKREVCGVAAAFGTNATATVLQWSSKGERYSSPSDGGSKRSGAAEY